MKKELPKGLVACLIDCLTVGWEGGPDEPVEIQAISESANGAGIRISFIDTDGGHRTVEFLPKEL